MRKNPKPMRKRKVHVNVNATADYEAMVKAFQALNPNEVKVEKKDEDVVSQAT